MVYKLTYLNDVKQDISEAKKWYQLQQPGLERRFSADIKGAIERLRTNPYSHAVRYKQIRLAHADVFPFSIHFFIDERDRRIVVIAVVHDSRNTVFVRNRKY